MTNHAAFETIDLDNLKAVNGGGFWGDLRDATIGAVRIVASPVRAAVRGTVETVGALRNGHSIGDSLASGLVQGAGLTNEPKLSTIPGQ